jgi:DNA modification methylase
MRKKSGNNTATMSAADNIEIVSGLGVFSDNRKLPLHRWYPFVEGFSSNLVASAMEQKKSGIIFDPFGGSGTTALTASVDGRESYFTEVNPFMAWVADVKINQVKSFLDLACDPEVIRKFQFPLEPKKHVLDENPFWLINSKRDFMNESNAKALVSFMHEADKLDEPYRSITRLAGATSILTTSNMVRRTDLRRRTATDKEPLNFLDVIQNRLQIFAEDLVELKGTSLQKAHNLGNDARQGWKSPKLIDLIVTSPPYLNGTNYCRNTKMELFACKFLSTEAELQKLRDRSIMAGINNVSSRKKYDVTDLPEIKKTVKKLTKASYDKRIPVMVNGYFVDMGMMFNSVFENSSKDALFLLDIGDSKFAGVHVDTPKLLVEVAEHFGWEFKNSVQLRTRRSFDGSLLSQDLLEFVKK